MHKAGKREDDEGNPFACLEEDNSKLESNETTTVHDGED